MGKVNNALKMLAILRSRNTISRKELAEELEVNPREITRYKDDLVSAGVNIKETRGRYGGYKLEGKDYLLPLQLSKEEITTLSNIATILKNSGSHEYINIENIKNKIMACGNITKGNEETYYSKGVKILGDHEEERKKWSIINDGKINCRKIHISYKNNKGENQDRVVHPYGLFTYYQANYFLGFCEERQEVRMFKLVRIQEIKLLKDKFDKVEFDIEKYLSGSIGLFSEVREEIILKIDYPYANGFLEYSWIEGESIQDKIEEGYIIYTVKCSIDKQLVDFIMGMGSNVYVVSPNSLREKIYEEYKKAMNKSF